MSLSNSPGLASTDNVEHISETSVQAINHGPQKNWLQLEVTILTAENLPRLKTFLGKRRGFTVTVSDGRISKKTKAVRRTGQMAHWNEKLDPFIVQLSSRVILYLYAERHRGKDILIGVCDVPVESCSAVPFDLINSDRGQQVTPRITISTMISQDPASVIPVSLSGPVESETYDSGNPAPQTSSVALSIEEAAPSATAAADPREGERANASTSQLRNIAP